LILYNLFPLLAGPVSTWTPHLERARSLGCDWVFVNPIQRPGFSGSLYSVGDCFALNPLLIEGGGGAAEAQVRSMAARAHGLGLKLMVDLVVNHTAIDCTLTREHPEWYEREDGDIKRPYCIEDGKKVVWGDLAQLDWEHTPDPEGLYAYVRRVVQFLLDLGFDGFRCDAAYQVPGAVWKRLIADVRATHPNTVFSAETLGCTPEQTLATAQAGFDWVFNSVKWWDFESSWLLEQYDLIRPECRSIAFPESHDTPRLWEEARGNEAEVKQRYLMAAVFSAGLMLPMGLEFGFRKKPHVVDTRPSDWEKPSADLQKWLAAVHHMKCSERVFREEGPIELLWSDNPRVMILRKTSLDRGQQAVLLLNKDVHGRQAVTTESLHRWLPSGAKVRCVSPENPMSQVAEPFHYELRPGEAVVLVAG